MKKPLPPAKQKYRLQRLVGIHVPDQIQHTVGIDFNALYQIDKQEYSLCCKKVAFFTGSLGKTKSDKKMYFAGEKSNFRLNNSPNVGTLYIFNAEQKEQSGGYDAAIIYWSKRLVPINEVVKRLKKH